MGNRAQASPFGHQQVQTRTFELETLGLDINDLESVDLNSVELETLGLEAVTFETVGAVMVGAETLNLGAVNLGAVDQEIMDFGSGACGTRGINTVRQPVRPGLVWSGLAWFGQLAHPCVHRPRAASLLNLGEWGSAMGWWADATDTPAD